MDYSGLHGREKAGSLHEGWEAYSGFYDIVLHVVNFKLELFFNVVGADSSTLPR